MTKATEGAESAFKPFDLASLNTTIASDKGARIEITHPTTGKGLGMFITVLGKHSNTFRDIVKARVDARFQAESMAAQKGKPVPTLTADKAERESLELLAACTVSWDTEIKDGDKVEVKPQWFFEGQWIDCNVPNAIKVFNQILWIREQVDNAIGDLENFIEA